MRYQSIPYSISDFYEWFNKGQLMLQPKFQRRETWSKNAKSYLIDTILRNIPIPKLYVRQDIDVDENKLYREVVDGQQRLRAIFSFLQGDLKILKIHNEELGGLFFKDLPDAIKKDFLTYTLSVDLLINASNRDVLDLFIRINSYNITLVAQEILNARFAGAFKQIVYKLGLDHLIFWKKNNILSDRRISRMGEAELASELVVAMIDGFQDGKRSLRKYYKEYDDNFPYEKRIIKQFRDVIDLIAYIFDNNIPKTQYKRIPLFYSLFCAFYDCKYGLPNYGKGKIKIQDKYKNSIFNSLLDLSDEIISKNPNEYYIDLINSSRRSTDKLNERITRHKYMWEAINNAINK